MFRSLTALLACPRCRGGLRLDEAPARPFVPTTAPPSPAGPGPRVEEGELACANGHRFPVVGSVPRLLSSAPADGAGGDEVPHASDVRATFVRQWRHYHGLRRIFGKDAAAMRALVTGERMGARIRAPWYRGKTVLDAGCGHGRYLSVFAGLGATAIGVDAGEGPLLAGVPTHDPSIHLVLGDVLALPLRDESVDLAFCDGVLHHTPDPRRGFAELCRVVRPGGAVYVWLYPREGALREAVFTTARAVTTRLPGAAVRTLSFAVAPLTAAVRSYSDTRFPRATWGECAQVVHDWIAPRLQSHHTFDEVAGWAHAEGLHDVERLPVAVGMVAWKPARAPA